MVSLAVVVAAILAVVFLVFSDQPATERLRNPRARSSNGPSPPSAPPRAATAPGSGPPPALVLQRQLALPSLRRTASVPAPQTTPRQPIAPRPRPRPVPSTAMPVGPFELETLTLWTRVRSSVALLVLLAGVGTAVAMAIGTIVFLAGLALRHALR